MRLNIYLIFNFLTFHRLFFSFSFFIIFNRKYRNRFLLSKIIKEKNVLIMYFCFHYKNFNFLKEYVIMLNDNVYNKCVRIDRLCDLFTSKNVNKY